MCTASHSSSDRRKSRNGPSRASHAACARRRVSSGTRWQWPPVYGDLASMAAATSWMKASSSAFCSARRRCVSIEIAATPEIFSTNAMICGRIRSARTRVDNRHSTPITCPARSRSGVASSASEPDPDGSAARGSQRRFPSSSHPTSTTTVAPSSAARASGCVASVPSSGSGPGAGATRSSCTEWAGSRTRRFASTR